MKINIIIPFKRLSGGIRVIFIYANYLIAQGHDVTCYMPMISYKYYNKPWYYTVKASISNMIKRETWFDNDFEIKKIPLIKEKYIRDADITIATAWQTAYDVKLLPDTKGKKIYFVQDYEVFSGNKVDVDGSYRLGLNIITISQELSTFLKEEFDVESVVVNNGVEEDFFSSAKIHSKDLENVTVLMMYNDSPHKRFADGLGVVDSIIAEYSELKVNIFGRNNVTFSQDYISYYSNPSRKLLTQLYSNSDIYLFTSEREAWGLPVIEAMASGCAVIGFNLGALKEVYNGSNAIIVSSFDEMERELRSLIGDVDRLIRIQNEAINTVRKFSWDKSCSKFENSLLSCC